MAEITEELFNRAYSICKDFLGGTWKKLPAKDFRMKHISGGLSNLLYLCSAETTNNEFSDGEPHKVLLRLYGNIIKENAETVVVDSVVFGLLAEKDMGPKLYGVFRDGRVEEYIPSRHLDTIDLHKPSVSRKCAQIMAQFHKLKMPLNKEPVWLFDTMTRYLEESLNNMSKDKFTEDKLPILEKITSIDLQKEVNSLRYILSQVHSPIVFCHNDMQEGNILIFEGNKSFKLQAIDFEYASYNYRGFDIGNHFCEWCYDYYTNQEFPYFTATPEHFPNRDQQLQFIRTYLEEMDDDFNAANIEEEMLLEIHAYSLASHIFWALWSIVQYHKSSISFGYLEYAVARFDHYFYQKNQLPAHVLPKM